METSQKTNDVQKNLEDAVLSNNYSQVKAALDNGADVNWRNNDGNTALHLAIDIDTDFDCLKMLLDNGANISIINKNGLKPLHLLHPDSYNTFLNLLKLEHNLDRNEYNGNTILHFLMQFGTDDAFLEQLHGYANEIIFDFNIQNDCGQTALHLAASRITGGSELEFILEHFDGFDVTLQDNNGNTFLHCYLQTFEDSQDIDFLNKILDGKYKCCSSQQLKKLLQIKNNNMYTVFHIYFKLTISIRNIKTCEKLLYAGADFNTCNSKGENVLHNMNVNEEEDVDVIKYVIQNGANINQQNVFLDPPIINNTFDELIVLLLEMGADVKVHNKVGKTPLMAILVNGGDEDLIRMFLEHGSDVMAADKFGSTCLHYAAWINADINIVKLLKRFGASISKDVNGKFPCEMAENHGNKALVEELCQCGDGVHKNMKELGNKVVNIDELIKTEKYAGFSIAGNINVSEVLTMPFKGSVSFVNEAAEIKQAVVEAVTDICKKITERDKMLRNTVKLSGSVSEGTKVGLPDEFDFCCLINEISESCEVDTSRSLADPGFAYLRLKDNCLDSPLRQVCDDQCYLESEEVYHRFLSNLREVLEIPSIFYHPNLVFGSDGSVIAPMVPNCKFTLKWTGAVFKDVNIDIDLVPACQIPNWWPSNSNLGVLQAEQESLLCQGSLILLQITVDEDYEPDSKLRVSANIAERMQMAALPQIARDTYKAAKLLCSDYICPTVQLSQEPSFLKKFLTSYMVKTCMFHTFAGDFLQDIKCFDYEQSDQKVKQSKLHECVTKVFHQLLHNTETESLPTLVFPWQNVFTFQDSSCDNRDDQNKRNCLCRKVYVKLILNLLGEEVDFSDIDIDTISQSIFNI